MAIKPKRYLSCAQFGLRHCKEIIKPSTVCSKKMMRLSHHRPASISTADKRQMWNFNLDIQRARDNGAQLSIPMIVYLHSPWNFLLRKLNMWKLKMLWDFQFSEARFIDSATKAAIIMTDLIRIKCPNRIRSCSTPLGYKQINHDLMSSDYRMNLMRFERNHVRRAIPVKVQLVKHYDHKFAFIDMVFVGIRRTNDFKSRQELREVKRILHFMNKKPIYSGDSCQEVSHPFVFAEIFVRFRRDYSANATESNRRKSIYVGGSWLISSYHILKFDVLHTHPQFEVEEVANPEDISQLSKKFKGFEIQNSGNID